MKRLKPILFVGTGSDVGKSVINAAFCRIFKQDGYTPAPFKAQNMSLNSYVSGEGLELGRAQVVQAEACGIPCLSAMNPILLKPTSEQKSQVVLNGKPIGDQTAREYFMNTDRTFLFFEVMKAWHSLDEKYNPIVMEGAGSISEINLWDKDIVNMRMAVETQAPTVLIADIDRGGVFGSLYGSILLLPENERKLIKGILINKFRGDMSLFEDGRKMLEELTGVRVIGVIPYFHDIHIEQEDSVVLDYKRGNSNQHKINVAVVLLKHMSNFTDFNVLERMPEVNLYYSANGEEMAKADIILLPGSKNTMYDLQHLRKLGLAQAILQAYNQGKAVYGICGGYQMMGKEIRDPHHVEGDIESLPGLGLLPMITTLTQEKRTLQTQFKFKDKPEICSGYEIHMGVTELLSGGETLCELEDGTVDGCQVSPKLWGTYLHGILDNKSVMDAILQANHLQADVQEFDFQAFKEEQYDKLAAHVRAHVDMEYVYSFLQE